MMNRPTITPHAGPAQAARLALSGVSYHPAFGNGDTPHYGL